MGFTHIGRIFFFFVSLCMFSYCHSVKQVGNWYNSPTETNMLKLTDCHNLIRSYSTGQLGKTETPQSFRASRAGCTFVNTRATFNPIQSFGYKTLKYGNENYCVPTMVHAKLTQTCDRKRRSFDGTRWNNQMLAMNARGFRRGDRLTKDERGHLIAAQVCGPATWFNLAPQTPALNAERKRLSYSLFGWRQMETKWANSVSGGQHINVYIFIDYRDNAVGPWKNRPKGFRVCSDAGDNEYFENDNMVIRL